MDSSKKGSESDDDEIIREIPICNSVRLQDDLYSFRYPLQPFSCRNQMCVRRAFLKPSHQELKLEIDIDGQCPNFDADRAEQIARTADGGQGSSSQRKKAGQEPYFENHICDKVVLKSLKTVQNANKYAALVYNGTEVHLTSLRGIFQFRPVFPYLDQRVLKNKKKSINKSKSNRTEYDDDGDDEGGGTDDDDDDDKYDTDDNNEANDENNKVVPGPSGAQRVNVHFKSSNSSKTVENDKVPIEYEPWSLVSEYHDENSTKSRVERLKLLAENTELTTQDLDLSYLEYLRVLIPKDQELLTDEPTLPSNVMSLHALRALPLFEQCRLLLKDAQIMPFQQLFLVLAGNEGLTADALLKILPKVAVLVRGNWIVKSDILYPKNTLSAISGVPAEIMCRARDYVLYLFTKNQYVERKKISSIMKMPTEEVKEIFTGFSRLSRSNGWELVYETDTDFTAKHYELAQRQQDAMDQRFAQLTLFLKENKRQRRKSRSGCEDGARMQKGSSSLSSDNDSGAEKKSPIAARRAKRTKNTDSDSKSK